MTLRNTSPRRLTWAAIATFAAVWLGCVGAPAMATPATAASALIDEYRAWLDQARTPAAAVAWVRARSKGWTHLDHLAAGAPSPLAPGARVIFTNRDRSALMVVVGRQPIASAGVKLIAAHIDTPSPRLDLSALSKDPKRAPLTAKAYAYGGIRRHHWLHTPLAVAGRVAVAGGREIDVELGLAEGDDFALYATQIDGPERAFTITLASIPETPAKASLQAGADGATAAVTGDAERDAAWLFSEFERRYGLRRADLATAELYLVPKARAREVGLDRALIGAHGQDDRSNSYIAWRAIADLEGTPERTVLVWLVDREEQGSNHVAGAVSRFLELGVAYLLRAQGARATEAVMARAFARSVVISADSPAAVNPNFPEVHEAAHGPIVGRGAVLFTYTGGEGKEGGSQANAALIREVVESFARAGQPLQFGLLGRVDEGGGGTVAKELADRGMDVVDIGVAGISLNSPMELFAKDDVVSAYRGFHAWLAEK